MNRILHLGLGRFHRGHQAIYYQRSGGWKVSSSTMRSSDERDKLKTVGLRYPVLELSHDTEKLTWVECIDEALSLHHDLARLLELIESPETKIITLTITEKGYCLTGTGELDLQHPGIRKDLECPHRPQTAIGLLAYGLQRRRHPITIISCDNLRANGEKLERAVRKFLSVLGYTEKLQASFPNTMVDRIVPSLLPAKVVELEARHGLGRSELIATETFSQWVIEEKFAGDRPQWKDVQFVNDVKPFEEMKLRLLNASHSYLAYAGLNRGYQFVHEAISDTDLHGHVLSMLKDEVIPHLQVPQGYDVDSYVDQLISRFRNDKLPHQLKQIAMDGSQKLPQRILSSISIAQEKNTSWKLLRSVVDEWLEFLWRSREEKIDDPEAGNLLSGIGAGKSLWKQEHFKRLKL